MFQLCACHSDTPQYNSSETFRNVPLLLSHVCLCAVRFDGYLWDSGLKEIWRDEHVRSIAEKIKTVDDFTELHIQPWNQEDVDVFHSSNMIVKTKEAN